jgi:riboflavin transporter
MKKDGCGVSPRVYYHPGLFYCRLSLGAGGFFMQVNRKTRLIVFAAMLAALSSVLMFFEFPLPLLPPFLKLDFSDIPVMIGAFVLGPLPALGITLVKDLIHATISWSGGVGELADFSMTGSMALTAGLIYRAGKSKRMPVLAGAVGVVAIMGMGALANYYLLLPFYAKMMPIDAILSLCAKVNPVITDVKSYILFGVLPFNLIKGVLMTVVTLIVYKRLQAILERQK